jgi:hypothetical protein
MTVPRLKYTSAQQEVPALLKNRQAGSDVCSSVLRLIWTKRFFGEDFHGLRKKDIAAQFRELQPRQFVGFRLCAPG